MKMGGLGLTPMLDLFSLVTELILMSTVLSGRNKLGLRGSDIRLCGRWYQNDLGESGRVEFGGRLGWLFVSSHLAW